MARAADRRQSTAKTWFATRRGLIVGLATLPAVAAPARAQRGFPERPIRLVVPYGPGTGNDTFARQLTGRIPAILGQPVVIENRPGANAIVGTEAVARAVPDGYTLLFGAEQAMCFNPALFQRLPYDPARDFAPVAGLVSASYVLVVAPGLPVRSVAELVSLARAQAGGVTFGSTGAGTASRLIGEVFARDAGIELTHVPYQSGVGQLFADLMTGTISMVFYPYQFLRPHLEAGRMRALATTSVERPEWLPDLPTMAELGFRRSSAATSLGIYAPAGTPEDRVARIADAFRQVLEGAEIRAAMRADGTSIEFRPPAEFAIFAAAARDRCRAMVALAGVRME